MVVTTEYIDELMAHATKIGKRERGKIGYKDDHRFTPVAIVVGPGGEQAVFPFEHKSPRHKQIMATALAQAARSEGALAIVLVSDTRWANSEKFSAYFHLPDPKTMGLEAWTKEYSSIVNGIYGGSLGNCPREVWEEALVIAVKGPLITPRMMMLKYREGKNDTVEWLQEESVGDMKFQIQFSVIPDWWEESNAKPA